MATPPRVLVIGGGIGGLTAARALLRAGFEVRVFERAAEPREVGAGIAVFANALGVLYRLGLQERLEGRFRPIRFTEVCTVGGRVVARLDMGRMEKVPGAPSGIFARPELLRLLADSLPAGTVVTGATCVAVEWQQGGVRARFAERAPCGGDLLVGADGLHSVVRAALWGEGRLRYSGQTCYRGIAAVPPRQPEINREIQGAGCRAGICPLAGDRVYWWIAERAPREEQDDPSHRRDRLLRRYHDWPWELGEILAATPRDAVLRNDMVDRPPRRRWSRGPVTLLGDAAHPTTPNLGQGGCMAIEDALVLARCLSGARSAGQPLAAGLRAYERARRSRTRTLVRQSYLWGWLGGWGAPAAVRLRETIWRAVPDAVWQAGAARQVAFRV